MAFPTLPPIPGNWSELTWQQLCDCWSVKQRYGSHPDVARVAALLCVTGCSVCEGAAALSTNTGEQLYRLRDRDGCLWTVTAREAAYIAGKSMPWFDYPYGDPGVPEKRDSNGAVVQERREPVSGYVGPMSDALMLPDEYICVRRRRITAGGSGRWPSFRKSFFQLPLVACNNLTWQQYRSLQAVAPQLFRDDIDDSQAVTLEAQFLAHALVPRSLAVLDTSGGSIRIRPHWEYRYNAEQAETLVAFWERQLTSRTEKGLDATTLFHVVFQVYQTALSYYSVIYPLLFSGEDKGEKIRDALQGEVGTVNTIMKYAGYAEQQQVYDSNLPFVLDILNTMAKEAKEIEKLNSKVRKK